MRNCSSSNQLITPVLSNGAKKISYSLKEMLDAEADRPYGAASEGPRGEQGHPGRAQGKPLAGTVRSLLLLHSESSGRLSASCGAPATSV